MSATPTSPTPSTTKPASGAPAPALNAGLIAAIAKRDFFAFFGNPVGYLFILAFVLVVGYKNFIHEGGFFPENKATLDLFNAWAPLCIAIFASLITMGSWSSELRQGTEQLLLTLPARDIDIVLGKYLACVGVFTVTLLFTLTHVAVLAYLGTPDLGLLLANYLGYFLCGAAMCAVGVLCSSLTRNAIVALIIAMLVGAFLVKGIAWIALAAGLVSPGLGQAINELSITERFESFARGGVALEDLVYFVGLAGAAVYATLVMLGRRLWSADSGHGSHAVLRSLSILVGVPALVLLLQQAAVRFDLTFERMLALTPEARKILGAIPDKRPVTIEAWISPDVPAGYRPTRDALLRMLRELDARGGDLVQVVIHATEPYSEEAQRAESVFQIKPERVESTEEGRHGTADVFMGLAFLSGTREVTIPFFHRGLPIQYELVRAIGAVTEQKKPKVGFMTGGMNFFGSFDFQNMSRSAEWQVLGDLRTQYDVREIDGAAAIDTSLQCLVVPQPSSLPQAQIDRLTEYLHQGGHALLLCDPFPVASLDASPNRPPGAGRNPFMQNQGPPPERGEIDPLLQALGVSWPKDRVVWDQKNPHPEWDFPKEVVFVTPAAEGRKSGFNEEDPITSGLQELALLWPGELRTSDVPEVKATRLLTTGTQGGWHPWSEMVQESFFGVQPLPAESREYKSMDEEHTLALRLQGKLKAPKDGEGMKAGELGKPFDVIVVADVDLVSDTFFSLRRQGDKSLPELDNVAFIANCIDALAGEDSYLALRKLRPRHRTLTRLEAVEAEQARLQAKAQEEAKAASKKDLDKAQAELDEKVKAIDARTDLDRRTKAIMLRALEDKENRKLEQRKRLIEDAEKAAVREAKTASTREITAAHMRIQLLALGLAVPLLVGLGVVVLVLKLRRESVGTPSQRRRMS